MYFLTISLKNFPVTGAVLGIGASFLYFCPSERIAPKASDLQSVDAILSFFCEQRVIFDQKLEPFRHW